MIHPSSQFDPSSPTVILLVGLSALAVILGCRAADLASGLTTRRAGATAVVRTGTRTPRAQPSPTELALAAAPSPSDTPEPSPTPLPTETPEPTDTETPAATRTPAPPTRKPTATDSSTPAPPPAPTRCPNQYCVVAATCIPAENTRAQGVVYANGVPVNGVRVRVSYAYGGAQAAQDFISGHDPINPKFLDPAHPGYYQIGMLEGGLRDGNWWVFLIDDSGSPISEGRDFKTVNVFTGNSCNIGVTDFAK